MKKSPLSLIILLIIFFITGLPIASAFWMWTPETNKWVNPKYSVKETPAEQLQYALEFYRIKEYKEAISELKKLLKNYPKAREAPEAQYYIGIVFEEQGQLAEAFEQYQEVIKKYPFSDRSKDIVQRQFDLGVKLLEKKADGNSFLRTLSGTDYGIIEIFETVIKNAPYGELAPVAQYKIGLYLMEREEYIEARDAFEKLVNDYPESEWVKAAKYQIALSDSERSTGAHYDQEVTSAAVEEFQNFVKTYPEAELSAEAKEKVHALRDKEAENNFVIAKFYEKQKNYESARIYYQVIVDDYSATPWATKALEKLQSISLKIK